MCFVGVRIPLGEGAVLQGDVPPHYELSGQSTMSCRTRGQSYLTEIGIAERTNCADFYNEKTFTQTMSNLLDWQRHITNAMVCDGTPWEYVKLACKLSTVSSVQGATMGKR